MRRAKPHSGRAPRALTALALTVAGCAAPGDRPARPELSLAGGGGAGAGAEIWLGDLGYQHPVQRQVTVGARVGGYRFELVESAAQEFFGLELEATRTTTGSGFGFGPEVRLYPLRALDGPWLGGGVLWFPFNTVESIGVVRHARTGRSIRRELEADPVELVAFGALGWTFRIGQRASLGLELDAGSAAGQGFAALLLRGGYGL